MENKIFHSVRLDTDKCLGCTNCIKHCPTEAIRVRQGKAKIIAERCIDCGECIRVCPYHAKLAVTDEFSVINDFKYRIALPAPTLYAQFKGRDSIEAVISGLKHMGFDDVYEVAKGAEIVSETIKRRIRQPHAVPMISSACPAVIRLIQVRFPELLEHVVDVDAPVEIAAKIAKMEFAEKNGVDIKEVGAFFITPCPAKATSFKNPLGSEKSNVDGAISILDVYGILSAQMRISHAKLSDIGERAGARGVRWANSGGESKSTEIKNTLAVDGIANVIMALEDMENDNFEDIDFFEGLACPGGCVGGPLVFESNFVGGTRITSLCRLMAKEGDFKEKASKYIDEGIVYRKGEIEALPVMKLDSNVKVAMKKMQKIEEYCDKLPGMDCGSCGAPTCRSLAEDIVSGRANIMDCVFKMREKVKFLAEQMVDLASKEN